MALQAESARAPILPAHAHLQLSEMATPDCLCALPVRKQSAVLELGRLFHFPDSDVVRYGDISSVLNVGGKYRVGVAGANAPAMQASDRLRRALYHVLGQGFVVGVWSV